jgi:ferredoxin-NADP reductase
VTDLLREASPPLGALYYLAGNGAMIADAEAWLLDAGVPVTAIRKEIAVRRRPAADHGRQAIQTSRERDGGHLEDPAGRRTDLRRLDAAERLAEVAEGVTYINGARVKSSPATADANAAAA